MSARETLFAARRKIKLYEFVYDCILPKLPRVPRFERWLTDQGVKQQRRLAG